MTGPIGAYDGRFGRLFSVASSRRLVAHAHPEWQFIFNIKGAPARFRVGTPMPIREGEVLAIPPWATHSKGAGVGAPSWMVSLLIAWPWLREVQESGLISAVVPAELPAEPWRARLPKPSRQLLERLCVVALARPDGTRDGFERDLAKLLSSVIAARAARREPRVLATSRHVDHRIRKALAIIRTGRRRRLRLGDLAGEVGLSRAHFFKLFKQGVGTSPLHAIDCTRIAWAVRALETDQPIAELADELGFSTRGHFTRFFVRHLFMPPAAYREALRVERAGRCDRTWMAEESRNAVPRGGLRG